EHLKGEDFFNVAKNPLITFKSTRFAFDGDKVKSATGDLTMNGITHPVTLTASLFQCAPHPMNKKPQCGGDFSTTVKRSDWGMKYAIPALGDEVTLRIPVESIKD
ncbi:MAG: YceI family protein, partial [Usitatibacter sp.]